MKFENSTEGYIEAKKWLQDNNLYPSCMKYELSTDGWNLIACANSEWEKLHEQKRR